MRILNNYILAIGEINHSALYGQVSEGYVLYNGLRILYLFYTYNRVALYSVYDTIFNLEIALGHLQYPTWLSRYLSLAINELLTKDRVLNNLTF